MITEEHDLEALMREVLDDPTARVAYQENELRRALARAIDRERVAKRMSVRELAKAMDSSASQVQRLLHKDLGGSITLRTLCRAAEALGCRVGIHFRPVPVETGAVVPLGVTAWTAVDAIPQPARPLPPQAPPPCVQEGWHEAGLKECG